MIIALKGNPQYSIDSNGIMSISTTWILTPDNNADGTSALHWLAFENEVEKWAGQVGGKYKKPKITGSNRDITEFEETIDFLVTDISYQCADGRTHYEVTFTNEQNLTVMRMVGNVSAEINENNEKTKSVSYQINVQSDDPLAIDANFITSGTTVDWAGAEYLVSSSSYNAVSKTRYELSITAQDMSVMMIGNPSKSTDAFGQYTMSATWRFSNTAFADWVQPPEGSDASYYLGLEEGSGYIITDVSAEPNGVLGYTVNINAKHVSKRLVKVSTQESRKSSGAGFYTSHNIQYQSDVDSVKDFTGLVGEQTSTLIDGGVGRITEVSIEESGRNDYDIQITANNEPQSSSSGNDSANLKDQVEVSMSQSELVLEPRQAGWFQGLSGQYYTINNPPSTRFYYTLSPDSLKDMAGSKGEILTDEIILSAIKSKATLGYDRIAGVQCYVDTELKWLSDDEIKALKTTDLKNVQSIRMEGFVYAQPETTEEKGSYRSLIFEPYVRSKHSPIYFSATPGVGGRDRAFHKSYLTYKIKFMDISVGMNYKGNAVKILKKPFSYYYSKAIAYIRCSSFTSYKGAGINLSEVTDEDGNIWTSVTCNIQALLSSNPSGLTWSSGYDNSYIENGGE